MFTCLLICGATLVYAWILRRLLALPNRLAGWLPALLLGLSLCALFGMTLGAVSLSGVQILFGVSIVFGIGLSYGRKDAKGATAARRTPLTGLEWICGGALASALGLAFVGVLAPLTSWDACVAHIALPSDYAREGRIFIHPGNVYSAYPHLLHSLWAVAFHHGGEAPVKLISWGLGLAALVAIYDLGRRMATRETGLIAAAALATAPIFLDQAGAVSLDLAFTAFSLAALSALAGWIAEGRWRWLLTAALLAGASCGIRHTGLLVIPLAGAGVLICSSTRRVKATALFLLVAVAAAGPWLLRSWWVSGNPVFPFLTGLFPSPNFEHINISQFGAHESIAGSGGASVLALLRFPWDILMRPGLYDGWSKSPGGVVLAFGLAGLLLGGKRAWGLSAYSVSGGLFFFFFQRLARYILPFFAPMMVVAALGAQALERYRKIVIALLTVLFLYGLGLHAAAIHFKIPVAFGLESRAAYLLKRVERYPAFVYANEHLRDGSAILTLDQRSYYIDAPTYQNHWGLKRIAGESREAQVAWLKAQGIRYVLVPREFLSASGALADRIKPMILGWRTDEAHFNLMTTLEIPSPRSGALEHVDVLEVIDE